MDQVVAGLPQYPASTAVAAAAMAASELPKLYQGVQKGSFGYKMLATMGWSEGQGLGANNQGIKEHIKVKKKQDAFGVGAAEQAHKLRDWTTGMVGYDAILSGLKEITRGPGGSSSSDDDSDSSGGHTSGYDSDSDTSGDAAAARKAKKSKKGTKQSSKRVKSKKGSKGDRDSSEKTKKRKQGQEDDAAAAGKAGKRAKTGKKAAAAADSSSADNSSSGSGSDSDSEPAAAVPAATLAKVSRVKAATHVGRYAKRERAKTVRNYSASDLAAILGLPSSTPAVEGGQGADAWAAAAAAAAGGGNAHQAGSSSSSSGGSDGRSSDDHSDSSSDSGRQGSEQRLRPGTPPGSDTPPSRSQQGFEADEAAAKPSGAPEADAAAANAWWRNLFVKSGGSGSSIGMRPAAKSINAHGFLEDDQTNLYMQAHATATTGKQGLGRSSMPKKVAGARWQGTKTKLGSDDEDDEQAAQEQQQQQHEAAVDSIAAAAAAAGREQYVKNGILIVLPKKRDAAQQQQQESQQQEQPKKEKKSKKSKKAAAAAAAAAEESSVGKKRKQPQDLAAAAATEQGGSSKKSKKQAAAAAAAADAQPAGTTAAAAAGGVSDAHKSVKWAKLAAKILAGAPKRLMRIQKLHKQVVAAAGYDVAAASAADTEALYQQMLRKLQKAEGLQVCDKYVGLASA